ncbi:hypothetical protein [Listeria cornellensis]|uniref:Uncharacterized protein n=1 Tax=Listeria cornellensis FSL F6-0969 TaxID=1265820 RepID=W7BJ53_9LIST|nr:hypothetical protein [Listeria cornellensis]EUJ25952.1 hypothetical protein PCORN_15916 [Listeria cornellensis FSL F6-0969]
MQKKLQIDNFFRQISGVKIEETFDHWSNLLMNTEEFSKSTTVEAMNDMLKKIVMYGSEETVKIASLFQQYNYKYNSAEKNEDSERVEARTMFTLLFLAAETICSLKNDFTGHKINVMDLMRMKLNDTYKKEVYDELVMAEKAARSIIRNGVH